jgi:hypothetical protein
MMRFGLNERFSSNDGERCLSAWIDVTADFQKAILAGVSLEEATMKVESFLHYDHQLPEDQLDDIIEKDLKPALKKIAMLTKIDGRTFVMHELIETASARGGAMSWFDGKTKLEAIATIREMMGDKEAGRVLGLNFHVHDVPAPEDKEEANAA